MITEREAQGHAVIMDAILEGIRRTRELDSKDLVVSYEIVVNDLKELDVEYGQGACYEATIVVKDFDERIVFINNYYDECVAFQACRRWIEDRLYSRAYGEKVKKVEVTYEGGK